MPDFFGKIFTKLAILLVVMAVMIGGAVYVSGNIFRLVAKDMRSLNEEHLPHLISRTEVLMTTGRLRDAFTSLLLAADTTETAERLATARAALDQLSQNAEKSSEADSANQSEIDAQITAISQDLERLAEAKDNEFEGGRRISELIDKLREVAVTSRGRLLEIDDDAYFDLAISGETTVDRVDGTLSSLVNEDVDALKTVLEMRSAVNFLAGTTLAYAQSDGREMRQILSELGSATERQIAILRGELEGIPDAQGALEPLDLFREEASRAFSARRFASSSELIATRTAIERELVTAIDDIEFNLFLEASETTESTQAAISELLENQVERIRDVANLSNLVQDTMIAALVASISDTVEQVQVAQEDLLSRADRLATLLPQFSEPVAASIAPLLEIAAKETGIGAVRISELSARSSSATLARDGAALVEEIAQWADRDLDSALKQIGVSSGALVGEVEQADTRMTAIAGVAIAVMLLASVATYLTIIRPMTRVAAETERLANGDLAPIAGLDRQRGELGRMVTALKVFRDGSLNRIRLEEEQEASKQAEERARRQAEAAQREREEQERESERRRVQAEDDRKRAEEKREAEVRAAAEAERQSRAEEQSYVMRILADALKRLSEGDFSAPITQKVPEAYEPLLRDFNTTVVKLSELLGGILESGARLRGSAVEISTSSEALSVRTEKTAATLEETVAALSELAGSVQRTARSAALTNEVGAKAKSAAEDGSEVVRDSISRMGLIDEATRKISAIVGVIEDIALQTNLLALNAGVEAARAGDAGLGFAVVASEVRALALRSSEAASEVASLIAESNTAVRSGVDATEKAGQSFEEVVAAVAEIADNVSRIARSAQEQSERISDINDAAAQLDQSTQQNAARLEETTAASQVMSDETGALAAHLSAFRLLRRGTDEAVDAA